MVNQPEKKKEQVPEAEGSMGSFLHALRDILKGVRDKQNKDNLSIVAAGVAFYAFLAIFPALAALVSIYGLFADPARVQSQITSFGNLVPPQAFDIIQGQLQSVAHSSGGALGAGVFVGLLLTVWSATKGMKALTKALNIAYGTEESRGFFRQNALAIFLTLGAIIFIIISLTLIMVVPILLQFIGLGGIAKSLMSWLRWPLLAILVIIGLAVLYRFAPDRAPEKWHWHNWGAVTATVLWLAVSGLFSLYVSHFGNYNKTYGSFGAVVILMLWFWLTTYIVLLGAELNAAMVRRKAQKIDRGAR
jgi:membrane protein